MFRSTTTVTGTTIFGCVDVFVSKLIVPRSDCVGACANLAITEYTFPVSTVTNSTVRFVKLVLRFVISRE